MYIVECSDLNPMRVNKQDRKAGEMSGKTTWNTDNPIPRQELLPSWASVCLRHDNATGNTNRERERYLKGHSSYGRAERMDCAQSISTDIKNKVPVKETRIISCTSIANPPRSPRFPFVTQTWEIHKAEKLFFGKTKIPETMPGKYPNSERR